jgi:hypothetical protein
VTKKWLSIKDSFEVIDVRKLTGNFLPMLLKKGSITSVGEGICVVQSFEPIPLYSTMADLGFEYVTEKVSDNEFRVYFYRVEKKQASLPGGGDVPLKPTAMVNFKKIDDSLADIIVNFWDHIWGKNSVFEMKVKLLLSLANGVGGGRFRQATRELVKGYAVGVTVAELDELFSMFVWNQGVGTFASEIGPSPLFAAYSLIKEQEQKGVPRVDILKELVERFGEKNPQVGTLYKGKE